jgi:hypothetical protein
MAKIEVGKYLSEDYCQFGAGIYFFRNREYKSIIIEILCFYIEIILRGYDD